MSDDSTDELMKQLHETQTQLHETQTKLGDAYREIRHLKSQLEAKDKFYSDKLAAIRKSFQDTLEKARASHD